MKNIAFVILNYNDSETTIKLVDDICLWNDNEFKYNIVIVDNRSTDESFNILFNKYVNDSLITVLQADKNGGYSYGNNLGAFYSIKHFSPDYIAICNPDIKVEQSTITKILNTFELDEKIAVVAPAMKKLDGEAINCNSNNIPTYKDDLVDCFASIYPKLIKNKVKENDVYKSCNNLLVTQTVPGSFFLIKTKVFEEIKGFDDNVFLFCEERILGRKLLEKNYISISQTDITFIHEHSKTIRKNIDIINSQKILYQSRLYYEQNYNKVRCVSLLFLKLCMKISIAFLYMLGCIKKQAK